MKNTWIIFALLVVVSGGAGLIVSCGGDGDDTPLDMAAIPTGCFDMGDSYSEGGSDELPVHEVCITGFYMDVYEVTNGQYAACVDDGGCTVPASNGSATTATYYGNTDYDDFPVIHVSWTQASTYCEWMGKRLPTEAEWEYAARGGLEGARYPWGDDITGGDANYQDSGDQWDNDTSPVGYYASNGFGLFDVAGNVWEWVNDWYSPDYYQVSPTDDPQGPDAGTTRVLHGGSWSSTANTLRAANRADRVPDHTGIRIGFRCAMD